MDTSSHLKSAEQNSLIVEHPRAIIHLDVDYFYAQVEEIRHPKLKGKPVGIKQKNLVVTCNYEARNYGVKKCVSVSEAKRACPQITLICGENLAPYRQFSSKITEILHQYTPVVERLGLDENFIDATSLVNCNEKNNFEPVGNIYCQPEEECPCKCHHRLDLASKIASDIRQKIFTELGLTCSAGIAHNKLLAKLGGSLHKPNQQTIIYPFSASKLLSSLGEVSKIPSVGRRTAESLTSNNILTVDDIRKTSLESLQVKIGKDLARKMKEYAEGIDNAPVKPSGKPQSIGLEDGFKKVSLVDEVESRLGALLRRLIELAAEDGRIPLTLKLTVRKQDSLNKASNSASEKRESRQCALPTSVVPSVKGTKSIEQFDHNKILSLAMKLFHRVVNVSKPFHLTLLGIAFTKFEQEKSSGRSSITSFLRKQVAVQSVLDISSEEGLSDVSLGSPMSVNQTEKSDCEEENYEELRENSYCNKTSTNSCQSYNSNSARELCSPYERGSGFEDEDDVLSEIEPSPKKTKLEVWFSGRRESPSIEMADLKLSTPSSSPISKNLMQSGPMPLKATIPIDLDKPVSPPWPNNSSSKKSSDTMFKLCLTNK